MSSTNGSSARVTAQFTDWAKRPYGLWAGCGYYRIVQPSQFNGFRPVGQPPVSVTYLAQSKADYWNWLMKDGQDTLLVQRIDSQPSVVYITEQVQKHGVKLIVDLDDDYLHINQLNPASKVYYHDATGRPSPQLAAVMYLVSRADGLIVTREKLKAIYSQFNPNITVLPNYLDEELWFQGLGEVKRPRRILEDEIRIGWAGSWSHDADFAYLIEALTEIFERHENVRFVSMGYQHQELQAKFPMYRWHCLSGSVLYEDYPRHLAQADLDIGVIPLSSEVFNECKSNIKALEMGALGIPLVATKGYGLPYQSILKDGVNGRLVTTKEEWIEALESLIASEELRREYGQKLQEDVRKDWLIQDHYQDWPKAIEATPKREAA